MDSQRIEDLTRNNDIPSNAVLERVRHMLQQSLHHIHNLDVDIKDLEKRLEELKLKRIDAQKQITPYQSIVSPMRRIPTDVLSEIFQYSLPENRCPAIETNECPMLLTHICRHWRDLALTDSRLWSRLYTTFSDDDMIPMDNSDTGRSLIQGSLMPSTSKERATQMLQTRIEAVREWISRAGATPLSISLYLTSHFKTSDPHSLSDSTNDLTRRFFDLLASVSTRIEALELTMPITIYRIFESLMPIPEMKALKSFRANFKEVNEVALGSPVAFLTAPNLRRVSLRDHDNRVWGSRGFSRHWNKLTHMSIHYSSWITEIATFLAHSPNLIHFQGIIKGNDSETLPGAPFRFRGHIRLPFLRTLYLSDNEDPRRTESLYYCIDAPSLHWVTYVGNFRPYIFSEVNPPPIPIIPLLHRSTGIRRLNINALDNTVWGIGRIFAAVPNLTHLIIGRESRSPKGSLLRTDPLYNSPRLRHLPWDLGGLLVDNDDPGQSIDTQGSLLPNLETLEISSHTGYFSDETLKKFIISRLNPPSSQRIANLKRVEVVFYRQAENHGVEEEIMRHAELVGTKIDLVLNYANKLNEPPVPCAPSFGLHGPDGQSWNWSELAELYERRP